MLERAIMAININNLSDARYFSAKGVMWMTFSVQEGVDNIQEIKEFLSWIAGPEPVIQSVDGNAAYAEWVMKEVGISKVMFDIEHEDSFAHIKKENTITQRDSIEARPNTGQIVYKSTDRAELEQVQNEETILFLENPSKEDFIALTKSMPNNPIAVIGGAEEKVGLKNYDDLDDRLDHMLM